jgi:DHA2 family multidrug resistance protein
MLKLASVAAYWNLHSAQGAAALDHEITRQAGLLAFLDDFRLMALVCLLAMPLALLLRPSRQS